MIGSKEKQNYWHLASIQAAAQGLVVMLVGQTLAKQYGTGTALLALCIGNLILWVIGLAMIVMTYEKQGHAKHALENVYSYLGKNATYAAGLVLMFAFLSWYTVQLKTSVSTSGAFLYNYPGWNADFSLKAAASAACLIVFLSMGGIKTIKWICVAALPFLALFLLYVIIFGDPVIQKIELNWKYLFPATMVAIIVVFPGIINLPTFFRHARSRSDAIMGLSLMTLFVAAFQFGSIWLQLSNSSSGIFKPYSVDAGWTLNLLLLLGFIAISTLCINLVNIYFASAALEIIKPKFADARGYAIIGLAGTLSFGLVQSLDVMEFIQNLTNCIIGSLGVVLLAAYLVRMITRHRPRPFEQHVNAICWAIGISVSAIMFWLHKTESQAFISGVGASAIFYLIVVFFEELWYSSKTILKTSIHNKIIMKNKK